MRSLSGEIKNALDQPIKLVTLWSLLYVVSEDGDALWTERYESVTVIDGAFSVSLGRWRPFLSMGANPSCTWGVGQWCPRNDAV